METAIPLIQIVLFLSVALGWRMWLHLRLHGSTGVVLFRSLSLFDVARDVALLAYPLLLLAMGWLAWKAPWALVWPGDVPGLGGRTAAPAGVGVCTVALVFIVSAQVQMGRSWRVGIEEGARPGLITHGLFRMCRNPIFLGMLVWQAGFALLVPVWASLLLAVTAFVVIEVQVRHEERYLLGVYGEEYRAYAARTGRFVPGIGRLPAALEDRGPRCGSGGEPERTDQSRTDVPLS